MKEHAAEAAEAAVDYYSVVVVVVVVADAAAASEPFLTTYKRKVSGVENGNEVLGDMH